MLQLYMLDSGIVPTTGGFADVKKEVKAHMAMMAPDERRRSARKFRKLWKKAAKQALVRARQTQGLTTLQQRRRMSSLMRLEEKVQKLSSVDPSARPTRSQERERSHMVFQMFMRDIGNELAPSKAKMRRR